MPVMPVFEDGHAQTAGLMYLHRKVFLFKNQEA